MKNRILNIFVILSLVLYIFLRAYPVFLADFPLGDGGFFFLMVQEIRQNAYFLPKFVNYNGTEIPFAYPPLAFYLAAALQHLGIELIKIFHYFPLAMTLIMVIPFYKLTLQLGLSQKERILAILVFAFSLPSFSWLIFGGGLTRSLGLLCFILFCCLHYKALSSNRLSNYIFSGLMGGLCILSHGGAAISFLLTVFCGVIAYSREMQKNNLICSLITITSASVLAAPWLILILGRHGIYPLLNAADTVPSLLQATQSFFGLIRFVFNENYFAPFPVFLLFLVGLGTVKTFPKNFGLFLWAFSILLFDRRQGTVYSTIPLAILSSFGFSFLIDTLVKNLKLKSGAEFTTIIATILLFTLVNFSDYLSYGEARGFSFVPKNIRDDFSWIKEHTEEKKTFLLVEKKSWATAWANEWFQALTGKYSFLTPQGTEWLKGFTFRSRIARHEQFVLCLKTFNCTSFLREYISSIDYIYGDPNLFYELRHIIRTIDENFPMYKAIKIRDRVYKISKVIN